MSPGAGWGQIGFVGEDQTWAGPQEGEAGGSAGLGRQVHCPIGLPWLPADYWWFIRGSRNTAGAPAGNKNPHMCEASRKLAAPPWRRIFCEDVYYR